LNVFEYLGNALNEKCALNKDFFKRAALRMEKTYPSMRGGLICLNQALVRLSGLKLSHSGRRWFFTEGNEGNKGKVGNHRAGENLTQRARTSGATVGSARRQKRVTPLAAGLFSAAASVAAGQDSFSVIPAI
jgi:hypothetical protein